MTGSNWMQSARWLSVSNSDSTRQVRRPSFARGSEAFQGPFELEVVLHRLANVAVAERIVVLDHGRIIQTGIPGEPPHAVALSVHERVGDWGMLALPASPLSGRY